ncbi:hypothetical protein [Mycolicibacterium conceptionense]|uniref:hypothetical protein n=1 Tax=Mycolicibacterium conceptionense TaxID=451644 RepID=UPI001041E238|nr:hypothetical protein [Mycolicibacterium conceptionense]
MVVIKDVLHSARPGRGYGSRSPEVINRVACLRHLAKSFEPKVGTAAESEIEQQASEELAKRYWDQYQEILSRLKDELLEARFSALPEGLRAKVIDLVRESGDAA